MSFPSIDFVIELILEQSEPASPASESAKEAPSTEKTSNANSPSQNESNDPDIVEIKHKRKDLHKTASIFLRTLAPSITKAEVEVVSKLPSLCP